MSSIETNSRFHHGAPRVLLVGRDRRYLTEACARLRAYGLHVATTCSPSEIPDLVERLELNVAVVDGSHYIAGIVRSMAATDAVGPALAVVTVADDSLISPLSRREVLPKWRSLDRIADHVELAFELRARPRATPRWEPAVAVA